MENIFGRINEQGNVAILQKDDGLPVTTIDANIYPVGSNLSVRYEHPEGIVLTKEDAGSLGVEIEDIKLSDKEIENMLYAWVEEYPSAYFDPKLGIILSENDDAGGYIPTGKAWACFCKGNIEGKYSETVNLPEDYS